LCIVTRCENAVVKSVCCCAERVVPVVSPASLNTSLNTPPGGGISPPGLSTGLYYTGPASAAAAAAVTSQQSPLPLCLQATDAGTNLPALPMLLSPPTLLTASDFIIGNLLRHTTSFLPHCSFLTRTSGVNLSLFFCGGGVAKFYLEAKCH